MSGRFSKPFSSKRSRSSSSWLDWRANFVAICFLLAYSGRFFHKHFPKFPLPVLPTVAAFHNDAMRGAWKSQGTNQRELVEQLVQAGIVRSTAVARVMRAVDRGSYCALRPKQHPHESDSLCYADRALGIGNGQTISAPHMHAYALEELVPSIVAAAKRQSEASPKVLDVGCGSGYLTACFGRWFAPKTPVDACEENEEDDPSLLLSSCSGRVFGIDVRQDLVDMTRKNMERGDADLLSSKVVDLSLRDGWKGLPEQAPFDAIHVGAAAASLPKVLATQLRVGGTLIIPIGPQNSDQHQVLYKIRRVRGGREDSQAGEDREYYASEDSFCETDFEVQSLLGVRYVPLVKGEDLNE